MINPGRKKKIIIGALIGLALCLGLLAWFLYASQINQTNASAETTPVVRALVIAPTNAGEQYAYAGDVRGRHESQLAFQVGGKIIGRHVESGSIVRPGQMLMQIDTKDVEQMVNVQQAQVAQAQSQLQLAEKNLKRYQSLFKEDVVSRSQFEQIQSAYEVALARHEQARAQYSQSANQFGYARLKADKAGVVSAISAEVGQVVAAGQVVVTLVQDGEREIEINVPENRIDAVRVASSARITFWALPDVVMPGRIREIAPMADAAARTYKVRVTLLQPSDQIRLGMTASVQIHEPVGAAATPYIPLSALYQTGGTPHVWIIQNGNVLLRPVKIGVFGNDQVQVLSGLNTGDMVVTAGVHKLREGQKVTIMTGEK
ncbi:MAG: efflux RND transporter periplasmic adaptor subunit [Deltaproteobacteria bacterium]